MIYISKPKKVKQWQIYTKDGKPVFSFGHTGFTLKEKDGNFSHLPAFTIAPPDKPFNQQRLAKCEAKLGEPCEWRRIMDTEAIGISF